MEQCLAVAGYAAFVQIGGSPAAGKPSDYRLVNRR
jgi:hypothetical protein